MGLEENLERYECARLAPCYRHVTFKLFDLRVGSQHTSLLSATLLSATGPTFPSVWTGAKAHSLGRRSMTPRKLLFSVTITLLVTLATYGSLAAQGEHAKHHHYLIVDLGTFGGPNSYVFGLDESSGVAEDQMLSVRGTVTGVADTTVPDVFCLTPECLVFHTFLWRDGVLTDLGSLPGVNDNDSFAESINAKGEVAGGSYNGLDSGTGLPLIDAVLWKDSSIIDLGTTTAPPTPSSLFHATRITADIEGCDQRGGDLGDSNVCGAKTR